MSSLRREILIGIAAIMIGVVAAGILFQWYVNKPKPQRLEDTFASDTTLAPVALEEGSSNTSETSNVQIDEIATKVTNDNNAPNTNRVTTPSSDYVNNPPPTDINASPGEDTPAIESETVDKSSPSNLSTLPLEQGIHATFPTTDGEMNSSTELPISLDTSGDPGSQERSVPFIETSNKQQTETGQTANTEIESIINDTVSRHNQSTSANDPYLSTISDETSDLTVTTAEEKDGFNIIRNVPQPGGPVDQFIVIKEGESLSRIAIRLYGDPKAYTKIYEANQELLSNPDRVLTGQRLRIPPTQ